MEETYLTSYKDFEGQKQADWISTALIVITGVGEPLTKQYWYTAQKGIRLYHSSQDTSSKISGSPCLLDWVVL